MAAYLVLAAVCLVLVVRYPLGKLVPDFWIYSVLGGITGALGNGFLVKALEKGELSVLGPINAWKSVIGMLFAFLLIGEIPNGWGFAGIALIIAGSYFVLDAAPERFSWAILNQPAIRYRFAALFFTAVEAVFDKQIILHANLTLAFASWCIFGALFSVLLMLSTRRKIVDECRKLDAAAAGRFLALVSTTAIMTASTNFCFSRMPVGEALALFQLSILLSVFFGHHIFREQGLVRKLAGSLIILLGSVFIFLLK